MHGFLLYVCRGGYSYFEMLEEVAERVCVAWLEQHTRNVEAATSNYRQAAPSEEGHTHAHARTRAHAQISLESIKIRIIDT